MKSVVFERGKFAHIVSEIWDYINTLKDGQYVIEIKEYRKKRSKTQNNYMWELIGKLSQAMNKSAVELYQGYIRDIGIYQDITLPEKQAETINHVWSSYGLGWFTDTVDNVGENKTIRCYYGSSSYNSKQMSVLVDKVVQDCKALDIDTLTPDDIARLEV